MKMTIEILKAAWDAIAGQPIRRGLRDEHAERRPSHE